MTTDPFTAGAPPYSTEAERQVLGAMMINTAVAVETAATLTASDFYLPKHAKIFAAIRRQLDLGAPTEGPAIVVALADDLERVGGVTGVFEITEGVNHLSAAHFAHIVHQMGEMRRWEAALIRSQHILRGNDEFTAKRDTIQRLVHEATTGTSPDLDGTPAGDAAAAAYQRGLDIEAGKLPPGIRTGLRGYDHIVGGHTPGQLIVIAGRPGMGKSILAQNWATWCAHKEKRPALIFSTEMTTLEMGNRLLSHIAEIPLETFKTGNWTPDQKRRITHARDAITEWPLTLIDTCRTIPAIRATVRRHLQKHGDLGLFVVDYLQRLQPVGTETRRELIVGSWIDDLKWLAQEAKTPAIVASQLNRETENRTDRKPALADLRDSGNIEQTADIAVLIHRPEYYDRTKRPGEADLDIAKHRNGQPALIPTAARLRHSHFRDLPPTNTYGA